MPLRCRIVGPPSHGAAVVGHRWSVLLILLWLALQLSPLATAAPIDCLHLRRQRRRRDQRTVALFDHYRQLKDQKVDNDQVEVNPVYSNSADRKLATQEEDGDNNDALLVQAPNNTSHDDTVAPVTSPTPPPTKRIKRNSNSTKGKTNDSLSTSEGGSSSNVKQATNSTAIDGDASMAQPTSSNRPASSKSPKKISNTTDTAKRTSSPEAETQRDVPTSDARPTEAPQSQSSTKASKPSGSVKATSSPTAEKVSDAPTESEDTDASRTESPTKTSKTNGTGKKTSPPTKEKKDRDIPSKDSPTEGTSSGEDDGESEFENNKSGSTNAPARQNDHSQDETPTKPPQKRDESPPTPKAETQKPSRQPEDDDAMKSTTKNIDDEDVAELEGELKREEKEARRIGGAGIGLALIAMIFTAHQMSENPDGIYASCCRLIITLVGCAVKIVLMPCRSLLGGANRHYSHMPVNTMDYGYREPYSNVEMS